MSIDTIIFEKYNAAVHLAELENADLKELIFANENSASEGNIYLGKIKSVSLLILTTGMMLF